MPIHNFHGDPMQRIATSNWSASAAGNQAPALGMSSSHGANGNPRCTGQPSPRPRPGNTSHVPGSWRVPAPRMSPGSAPRNLSKCHADIDRLGGLVSHRSRQWCARYRKSPSQGFFDVPNALPNRDSPPESLQEPSADHFCSTLKPSTARKTYCTRNEAKADVFEHIERFHNPKRQHSTTRQPTQGGA